MSYGFCLYVFSGASGAEGQVLQRLHPGSRNTFGSCHSLYWGARREVKPQPELLKQSGLRGLTQKVYSSYRSVDLWHAYDGVDINVCPSLRHLVPLTDLKPVNPVPAWNVAAPTRKGDLGMFNLRLCQLMIINISVIFFILWLIFALWPFLKPGWFTLCTVPELIPTNHDVLSQTRTLVVSGTTGTVISGSLEAAVEWRGRSCWCRRPLHMEAQPPPPCPPVSSRQATLARPRHLEPWPTTPTLLHTTIPPQPELLATGLQGGTWFTDKFCVQDRTKSPDLRNTWLIICNI